MKRLSLLDLPNQNLEFITPLARFDITLNQVTPTLLLSTCSKRVNESGVVTLLYSGYPVVTRQPLIPFKYMVGTHGNFYFITPNNELPTYTRFGIDHRLYYLNDEELEFLNG